RTFGGTDHGGADDSPYEHFYWDQASLLVQIGFLIRLSSSASCRTAKMVPFEEHDASRARWRSDLAWHALPPADRPVGLPHQAVRLVFSRGLWRSLGGLRLRSRERDRLRSSLNHVHRLALRHILPQRSKRLVHRSSP